VRGRKRVERDTTSGRAHQTEVTCSAEGQERSAYHTRGAQSEDRRLTSISDDGQKNQTDKAVQIVVVRNVSCLGVTPSIREETIGRD
jgi:hypothetical protein